MADHARHGQGGVLLHSHTRVRPDLPLLQFKPPRGGERIRAVLWAQAAAHLGQPTHCIVQGDKPWECKHRNCTVLYKACITSAGSIRNPSACYDADAALRRPRTNQFDFEEATMIHGPSGLVCWRRLLP